MDSFGREPPQFLKYIGTIEFLSTPLNDKSWCSLWLPIKIVDIYFRALGVVVFANNPLTGIFICIGLLLGDPLVALGTFVAAIAGIFTSKILNVSNTNVCNGVAIFNCILLGGVVTGVTPLVVNLQPNVYYFIFLFFGAIATVFAECGIQAFMSPPDLPIQSVPFNIVAICMLLLMKTYLHGSQYISPGEENILNNTFNGTNQYLELEWNNVMKGTVLAAGQVYGVNSMEGSILIWIGYFIYSPLLTLFLYLGSLIGALIAVLVEYPTLGEIYVGLWSYNSLLASGALSFFVVQTPLGIFTTLVAAVFAVVLQIIYTPLFLMSTVPVISYPFNTTVMILIAISLRKTNPIAFVHNRSFPEDHLFKHYKIYGNQHDIQRADADELESMK